MKKPLKHAKWLCSIKVISSVTLCLWLLASCKVTDRKKEQKKILTKKDSLIVYPAPGTAHETDSLKQMLDEKRKSRRKH